MANVNAAQAAVEISNNMAHTTDNIVSLIGTGTSRVYGDGTAAIATVYKDGGNAISNSIDAIWSALSNQIVPAMGKGLVMTKDLFMDLVTEYVKYLIITDALKTILYSVGLITCVIIVRKTYKMFHDNVDTESGVAVMMGVGSFFCCLAIPFLGWLAAQNVTNLAMDIWTPKIRVIQQIGSHAQDIKDFAGSFKN